MPPLYFKPDPMPPRAQEIYKMATEVATYYKWDHYKAVAADKETPKHQKRYLDSRLPGTYIGRKLHGKGKEDLEIYLFRFTIRIYAAATVAANTKEQILLFKTYGPTTTEQKLAFYRPGEGTTSTENWELRLKELYEQALRDRKRYENYKAWEAEDKEQAKLASLNELRNHTNFIISDQILNHTEQSNKVGFITKIRQWFTESI